MEGVIGLSTTEAPVPLVGVRVEGEVLGRTARVKVLQLFRNVEARAVEAVYRFPLPDGCAPVGFRARVGERDIRGHIEEREKAFELYDKALENGDGGYLLDEERPNIFTLSVGNLPPAREALVEIEYLVLLDGDARETRFHLPTTISPRYVPEGREEDGIPETDRIHPEYAAEVPYGLTLELLVRDAASIRAVESPSHPIGLETAEGALRVRLAAESVRMDRDFVLTLVREPVAGTRAYVLEEERGAFVQLDLLADLEEGAAGGEAPAEAVFVVDCSGSMQGDSIEQARSALEVAIKALSSGALFNVYRFGTSFEAFFDAPRPMEGESAREAIRRIRAMQADMGGTEMLSPLRHLLSRPPAAGLRRSVVLLTDGEVANEAEVIGLAAAHGDSTRFFAVGIGAGVNDHLIRGLARAGRGACELICPGERIEPKMLRLFGRLTERIVSSLSIDWTPSAGSPVLAPAEPLVAVGKPTTIFARLASGVPQTVRVSGSVDGCPRTWEVPVTPVHGDGLHLPSLWARERIRDLEESPELAGSGGSHRAERRAEAAAAATIALSREFSVLCAATSFVAIEERGPEDKTTGETSFRPVPTLLTIGWHGRGRIGAAGAGMRTPSAAPMRAMSVASAGAAYNGLADHGAEVFRKATAKRRVSRDQGGVPPAASGGAAPAPDSDRVDLLMALLSCQRVEGGILLDAGTLALLGLESSLIDGAAASMAPHSDSAPVVLGTAIVLRLLEERFATERASWEAVVQKSRAWLLARAPEGITVAGEPIAAWAAEIVTSVTVLP